MTKDNLKKIKVNQSFLTRLLQMFSALDHAVSKTETDGKYSITAFHKRELGTSKIDCEDKMAWQLMALLFFVTL